MGFTFPALPILPPQVGSPDPENHHNPAHDAALPHIESAACHVR
jgi:hypothetical protein